MIKFKGDEEPVVKELKNVKLGCFTFEFKETGDFEMIVEKNVTVAPLAEVMMSSESGMGSWEKVVETTTITVTMPYTSYVTTYLTTGAKGEVTTVTQTITQYKTHTLTKVKTKWKTTTTTVTVVTEKRVEVPVTTTVTKTVTKYITRVYTHYGGGLYGSGVILYYPYSEFIFIGR